MKKPVISVASGKGGTGKTTIASCLVLSTTQPVQFLDCDVEEPNADIFLKPDITRSKQVSVKVPAIDYNKCTFCGKCSDICIFNAIAVTGQEVLSFPELCHSCGGCWLLCPEKAISTVSHEIGNIKIGQTKNIDFLQGVLEVGAPSAPPVIKELKKEITRDNLTILDAPPGTSCPVVETMEGTDYVIMVTEPTLLGLSDLKVAIELARLLNIPHGVIINRASDTRDLIDKYCEERDIPVLFKLYNDKDIAQAYAAGIAPVEIKPELKNKFKSALAYIERVTAGERTSCNQR